MIENATKHLKTQVPENFVLFETKSDFDIKYLTNKDINTFEKIINAKLLCVKIINSTIVVSYLFNE